MGNQRASEGEVAPFAWRPLRAAVPRSCRVATSSFGRPNGHKVALVPDAELLEAPGAGTAAARGGALRVGAYAGGQAMAVLAAALLFRHLGVDDAGRYITVLSLVAVVQGLADVGLSTLAARQLALSDEAERRALMGRLLGLRLALAGAGAVVALGFAVAAGYNGDMVAGV